MNKSKSKHQLWTWLSLLLTIVIAFGGTATSSSVQASVISTSGLEADAGVITNSKTGQQESHTAVLDKFGAYNVLYHWSIPDGVTVNNGDTASFTLPSNVQIAQDQTCNVYDQNKNVVGTAFIAAGSQTGTITFNGLLGNKVGRTGTLSVGCTGTHVSSANNNNSPTTQPGNGSGTSGSPSTGTGQTPTINKVGWYDKKDSKLAYWQIVANLNGESLNNPVITDNMGPGMQVVSGTLTVKEGTYVNGTFQGETDVTSQSTVTINGSHITVKLPSGSTDKAIAVEYQTKMTDDETNYSNSATISADNVSKTKTDSAILPGNINGTMTYYQGKIMVKKVDALTGAALPGASFTLFGPNHEVLNTLQTGTDGIAVFNNLNYGTYYLQETSAPDGYDIDSTDQKVTLNSNELSTAVTVKDRRVSSTSIVNSSSKTSSKKSSSVVSSSKVSSKKSSSVVSSIKVSSKKSSSVVSSSKASSKKSSSAVSSSKASSKKSSSVVSSSKASSKKSSSAVSSSKVSSKKSSSVVLSSKASSKKSSSMVSSSKASSKKSSSVVSSSKASSKKSSSVVSSSKVSSKKSSSVVSSSKASSKKSSSAFSSSKASSKKSSSMVSSSKASSKKSSSAVSSSKVSSKKSSGVVSISKVSSKKSSSVVSSSKVSSKKSSSAVSSSKVSSKKSSSVVSSSKVSSKKSSSVFSSSKVSSKKSSSVVSSSKASSKKSSSAFSSSKASSKKSSSVVSSSKMIPVKQLSSSKASFVVSSSNVQGKTVESSSNSHHHYTKYSESYALPSSLSNSETKSVPNSEQISQIENESHVQNENSSVRQNVTVTNKTINHDYSNRKNGQGQRREGERSSNGKGLPQTGEATTALVIAGVALLSTAGVVEISKKNK